MSIYHEMVREYFPTLSNEDVDSLLFYVTLFPINWKGRNDTPQEFLKRQLQYRKDNPESLTNWVGYDHLKT